MTAIGATPLEDVVLAACIGLGGADVAIGDDSGVDGLRESPTELGDVGLGLVVEALVADFEERAGVVAVGFREADDDGRGLLLDEDELAAGAVLVVGAAVVGKPEGVLATDPRTTWAPEPTAVPL